MKKRLKRLSALCLAGAMVMSMVACGNTDESKETTSDETTNADAAQTDQEAESASDTQQESSGEPVTIKIAWWGGDARHEYTQELLDLYTQSHPNVTFETTPSGWDGYFDKLATQAASGTMPDIVQMDYMYISTYAKNNSLADLSEFISDGTIDVSGINESILNTGKVDDKFAGMVLSTSIVSVGYNPDVLAAAGVEEPTNDWTWSDFFDMCEKVTAHTGKPAAMISSGVVGDTNVFEYWVRQHGQSLFKEDGTGLGYEDDAVCADYFKFFKNMMDDNTYPDPDEFAQILTLGQDAGPVVTGEAAFCFDWNNYTTRMSEQNPNLKLITPPLADGTDIADAQGLWLKPGMFFSVAETSQVKKECAEFINWFVNSEEANDIIMAERGTPVSSAVREYMIASGEMTTQQMDMFGYVDIAAALSGDTPLPQPSGISEINEAFSSAGNSVFYDQATPEEAAAKFREEVNEILSRNNQ